MTLIGKNPDLLTRVREGLDSVVFPSNAPPAEGHLPLSIAHRGSTDVAPENTVRACQIGIERGADGVEVDVCVTRSGHVVLWHDRDPDDAVALARQKGAEGLNFVPRVPELGADARKPVSRLDVHEFREHYGYRPARSLVRQLFESDEGELIKPDVLDELASFVAEEKRVAILAFDIKLSAEEAVLAETLLAGFERICARHPVLRERRLLLLCPELEVYRRIVELLPLHGELLCFQPVPDFELGRVREVAGELGARHVSIGLTPRRFWPEVRKDVIAALEARKAGSLDSVIVWGANEQSVLAELVQFGVDGVITDEIRLLRALVSELSKPGAMSR